MISGAPDPPRVPVPRPIPVQQLIVAESREGPTDEHERVAGIESERVARRVPTERRTGDASVYRRFDVRESNAACKMAIGIRHRHEGIDRVDVPPEISGR